MKRAILIIAGLAVLASPVLAATPTPAPSPTPVPLIPEFQDSVDVNAFCEFTNGSGLTLTFTDHRTKAALNIPPKMTMYITDILWNCQSACEADIRWTAESVVYVDSVRFLNESQGKVVSFDIPAYSPALSDEPRLHLNASSAGVVYIHGVIR